MKHSLTQTKRIDDAAIRKREPSKDLLSIAVNVSASNLILRVINKALILHDKV